MKTLAPIQVMNLTRSVIIFFIVTSLAWIAANYVILRDFYIGWPVLIGNLFISAVCGWWWYRRNHHAVFSYGEGGFELQKGGVATEYREWSEFSRVSLVHEGYGRFSVRLYENGKEYIDIPASDLKLEPSDFRFQVMELITGGSPTREVGSPRKES